MAQPVTFKLTGGNWNRLNKVLNQSPELQEMLDSGAREILKETRKNIDSGPQTSMAKWSKKKSGIETKSPGNGTGLKMRFVSIPSIGFEARYAPLKKGLDSVSE